MAGIDQLPVEGADASFHLIFELHHDGSRQVDISVGLPYGGDGATGDGALLGSTGFYEFDIVDGVESLMGVFLKLVPPPEPLEDEDQVRRLDQTLRALGSTCQVSNNPDTRALVAALGVPVLIAVLPSREDAVRMLFEIPDTAQLDIAKKILQGAGVPSSSLLHFEAIEP